MFIRSPPIQRFVRMMMTALDVDARTKAEVSVMLAFSPSELQWMLPGAARRAIHCGSQGKSDK